MGVTKKLLIVTAALSLSACTMFEGKNTFMTYQDLQTKVRQHDSELKAVQDELAQLKQSKGANQSANGDASNGSGSTSQADDGLGLSQSETMAAPSVAPAVTAVPSQSESSVQAAPVAGDRASNDDTMAQQQPQAVQQAPVKPTNSMKSDSAQYGVQLAAYATRQEAVNGWRFLSNQAPDVFVNLEPHVAKAQINGRTLYQLKVGPFLDRAYSVGFCNMLKQKGKDCIVKKFDGEPL